MNRALCDGRFVNALDGRIEQRVEFRSRLLRGQAIQQRPRKTGDDAVVFE